MSSAHPLTASLSRASLGHADYVLPQQRDRHGLRLDGRGGLETLLLDQSEQLRLETEVLPPVTEARANRAAHLHVCRARKHINSEMYGGRE